MWEMYIEKEGDRERVGFWVEGKYAEEVNIGARERDEEEKKRDYLSSEGRSSYSMASRENDSTHYRAICVIYCERLNLLLYTQPRGNSLIV